MTTEEVKTRFVADVEKYKRDIQEAQKVLNKFVKTSDTSLNKREAAEYKLQTAIQKTAQEQYKSMNKASHSYKALGGDIAHVARNIMTLYYSVKSIGALFKTGVGFNVFMESQQAAFSVMMKSADGAKAKIEELYQFAVKSPLTFKETVASARQLLAYGYAPNELTENMRVLGTVAIAAGQSLGDIVYLQGTLRTQGRAYTRDLFQLANRGIPIYEELAKVMNVNQTAIKKMVEEGKIGYKEVEQAFKNMVEEGGRYSGMLEEYMKTFEGKYSMLKDIFEKLSGTVTKSMTDALKKGIDALTEYFESDEAAQLGESIGFTLGQISEHLINIGLTIIKMLPVLGNFLKIWIAMKVIGVIRASLALMPDLFLNLAFKIETATAAMAGFAGTSATANFTSGISLLLGSLKSLGAFLLSPQGLAIMGIGAAISAAFVGVNTIKSRQQKGATDDEYLKSMISGESGFAPRGFSFENMLPDKQVKAIEIYADKYKKTREEMAKIFYYQGLITEEIALQSGYNAIIERNQNAQRQSTANQAKRMEEYTKMVNETMEARVLPTLGIDPFEYFDPSKISDQLERELYSAEYIKLFEDKLFPFDKAKTLELAGASADITKEAYLEAYKERYKQIEEAFENLVKEFPVAGDKAVLKADLVKMLNEYAAIIEKYSEDTKAPKLDKWFTLEWMVKSTEQAYDDLELQRDKDLDSARQKYEDGEISLQEALAARSYMWEKYFKDLDEKRREDALKEYETMTQGNTKFFEDLKIKAMKSSGLGKIGYSLAAQTEGTEFGTMLSTGALGDSLAGFSETWLGEMFSKIGDMSSGAGGFIGEMLGPLAESFAPLVEGLSGIFGTIFEPLKAVFGPLIGNVAVAMFSFLSSIENVSKVLNPLTTIFEAMRPILQPLINHVLQPVVNVLEMFGDIIARLLTPFLGFLQVVMSVAYVIQTALMIPLQMLGNAFSWLYDYVIVPFGNGIIDVLNGIIKGLNDWLGWLGVDIKELDGLKTTGELIKEFNEGLKKELTDSEKAFVNTFEAMADKLNGMVDKQIQSLQDLYEVGAISGAEYEARSKQLDSQKIRIDEAQLGVSLQQLTSIDSIKKWLIDNAEKFTRLTEKPVDIGGKSYEPYNPFAGGPAGIPMSDADIEAMDEAANIKAALEESIEEFEKFNQAILSFGRGMRIHLASGTDRIPYDNFPANLHKDEGVIPGDFMSAVRSGELVLSGSKGGAGSTVNNYYSINVEGTVVTENELIEKVHKKTGTMLRRGYVS